MVKLVFVQINPFTNQPQSGLRSEITQKDISPKIKHGFPALIFHMHVRGIVLVIIHPDYDTKEHGYDRHPGSSMA
jgi:hypothetical protein